jgi:predicted O-linked N-acetylglucosamine transferase (SPINDLY family)
VFGEFVNVMKLSPRCLAVWREILGAIENGMLAFSPQDAGEYPAFLRQVKAAGIPEEKIVFIPYSKDEGMARARYHLVDIVLDTFPYSGGNTTLAALDMGIPVVTLAQTPVKELLQHSEEPVLNIRGKYDLSPLPIVW